MAVHVLVAPEAISVSDTQFSMPTPMSWDWVNVWRSLLPFRWRPQNHYQYSGRPIPNTVEELLRGWQETAVFDSYEIWSASIDPILVGVRFRRREGSGIRARILRAGDELARLFHSRHVDEYVVLARWDDTAVEGADLNDREEIVRVVRQKTKRTLVFFGVIIAAVFSIGLNIRSGVGVQLQPLHWSAIVVAGICILIAACGIPQAFFSARRLANSELS